MAKFHDHEIVMLLETRPKAILRKIPCDENPLGEGLTKHKAPSVGIVSSKQPTKKFGGVLTPNKVPTYHQGKNVA